ncbi:hypothetical protein F4804DRAFT_305596 [Jackrogersella minutella]|nr:hypothetical protein F4804DRAFT_305596 [Jackrogersella minutella]
MVSKPATDISTDLSENGIPSNEFEQTHRRMRACIACRNMKIKCISVPGSKHCESCLRFSRQCQDPGPPKARVKTSQKFSELEKKIDALTNALDIEKRRNQQSINQVRLEALWSKTPDSNTEDRETLSSPERQGHDVDFVASDGRINTMISGDLTDVIDLPTASVLYDHWNRDMRPLMPVIQFSSEENASTTRAKKPTLFLTIMTVASTSIRPALVPNLLTRLNSILAREVFIQGAKSLDLLQSLILFSQYYIQPPDIKAFALPQHVYSAVVMSHDLGLNSMSKPNERGNSIEEMEIYRTLLAVYFGASSAATLLRRHQPLLFTSSHRAYVEALTRVDGVRSDDHWLCSLVVLQEIFDDVSKTLNASYNFTDESFDDFRTQHLLRIFRQRLADWKLSKSGEIDPRLKSHAISAADLYIHQVAVRVYSRQMNAWYNSTKNGSTQLPPVFTVTHTDALCYCLKVGADAFNTYLSLDDATIRSLPNVFLVWNLCVAVCLVKLGHFASDLPRTSGSENHAPPSPTDLLEAMVQRLSNLSQHGKFPQSRPFIVAFKKLRIWFQQKKAVCLNNNGDCDDGRIGPIHGILGTQTPPVSPSATELDIRIQRGTDDRNNPGNRLMLEPERDSPTSMAGNQYVNQQSLDWDPNPNAFDHAKGIPIDNATVMNTEFDATGGTDYFNTDLGNLGFGVDDMKEMETFMTQIDDAGLWSLL